MRVDNLLEIFPPGVYPLVGYGQEYGLVPGLKFSLGGGAVIFGVNLLGDYHVDYWYRG